MKTNAMRQLDLLQIGYEVRQYTDPGNHQIAIEVAKQIGLEASQCFKTLATENSKKELFLAVIPGDAQLNLKALAQVTQTKKLTLLSPKELKKRTGYLRGEVSPLGLTLSIPTVLDSMAQVYEVIGISAGKIGYDLVLKPQDLYTVCQAQWGEICRFA